MLKKIHKTSAEWKKILTPEQFRVMREKGTEPAHSCEVKQSQEQGIYHCAACGLALFKSSAKFSSGTGWPSFYEPFKEDHLLYLDDFSLGTKRTEIRCARCESHLGHVFGDGPAPTGQRFCLNGVALNFKSQKN